jgi:hypothetical protein
MAEDVRALVRRSLRAGPGKTLTYLCPWLNKTLIYLEQDHNLPRLSPFVITEQLDISTPTNFTQQGSILADDSQKNIASEQQLTKRVYLGTVDALWLLPNAVSGIQS